MTVQRASGHARADVGGPPETIGRRACRAHASFRPNPEGGGNIDSESVDLVYLDPPFHSNADYKAFFAEQDGSRSAAQMKAFEDTWHWD